MTGYGLFTLVASVVTGVGILVAVYVRQTCTQVTGTVAAGKLLSITNQQGKKSNTYVSRFEKRGHFSPNLNFEILIYS